MRFESRFRSRPCGRSLPNRAVSGCCVYDCLRGGAQGDSVACLGHPALPTVDDRYAWPNGSLDAYRRSAALLNARGKRLVVSLKNGFVGAAPIAAKFKVCPVPMDDFVAAMKGEKFIRFHEYFGALSKLKDKTGPSGIDGATMCMNLIHTAQVRPLHPARSMR